MSATTVRGWLQRAQGQQRYDPRQRHIIGHALDPMAAEIDPIGSPLGDTLEAIGLVVSAYVRLLGPRHQSWQAALAIIGAGLLAAHPRPVHSFLST